MGQKSVSAAPFTFKGGTLDDMNNADIISRNNSTRQVTTIAHIATAVATGAFSVVINSSTYIVNSGVHTVEQVFNTLAYAIEAGEEDLIITEVTSSSITFKSKSGAAVVISAATTAALTVTNVITYTSQEIPFGCFVAIDTANATNAKAVASAAEVSSAGTILGVAIKAATENAANNVQVGYATDDVMDIAYRGNVWVRKDPLAAFVPGSAVFIRQTIGARSLPLGSINDDADTATCTAIPATMTVRILKNSPAGDEYVLCAINC